MAKTLVLLDCCLSDFFQGHQNDVLAVPVNNNMTVRDVITGIESEANSFSNDPTGFTWEDFDEAFEDFSYKQVGRLNTIAFPNLEDEDDDCESVYAYFTVVDA